MPHGIGAVVAVHRYSGTLHRYYSAMPHGIGAVVAVHRYSGTQVLQCYAAWYRSCGCGTQVQWYTGTTVLCHMV